MSMTEMKLTEFLDLTASDAPAPGGGSVAGLAAALGSALGEMVLQLSYGKKSYLALDSDIQKSLEASGQRLKSLRTQFLGLIDRDTEAFNAFMDALKLPKSNEEEKKKRSAAMAEASKKATAVPMETAEACVSLLECLPAIARYGNKNAVTDAGVAALLARAACEAAIFNVKINLPGIDDPSFVDEARLHCQNWLDRAEKINQEVVAVVYSKIE